MLLKTKQNWGKYETSTYSLRANEFNQPLHLIGGLKMKKVNPKIRFNLLLFWSWF